MMAADQAGSVSYGPSPTGGATLGDRSAYPQDPAGGASLGKRSDYPPDYYKQERAKKQAEAAKHKPSDVTGDPYDDHPGMVYANEGPFKQKDLQDFGEGVGHDVGDSLADKVGTATGD